MTAEAPPPLPTFIVFLALFRSECGHHFEEDLVEQEAAGAIPRVPPALPREDGTCQRGGHERLRHQAADVSICLLLPRAGAGPGERMRATVTGDHS